MAVQVQEQTTSDGQSQSGVSTTTQTMADPATGATTKRTATHMWSGQNPLIQMIWLVTGVVVVLLAMDFIFHAAGANNVGFAAFVFSIGTALAAPFAGIFNTTYATQGNLIIWADALAVVVYALLASLIARVVNMMTTGRRDPRAV